MATYYVKNGGSDAADGLSDANAWATVAKVNGSSFSAGDSVLFKRGSVWREQLTIPSSGSSGNPITFGNYSTGNLPELNGADLKTSWTDNGGNTWRATATTEPELVMFDGVLGIPVASAGACDAPTKWFWSTNLLYTYGTVDPSTTYAAIEAAVRPTDGEAIININAKSYVTIDGLRCVHSNTIGIKNYAAGSGQTDRTITNCQVGYCADGGICIYADNFTFAATVITYNEVFYTNLREPYASGALEGITLMKADGAEIAYNTIHHHYEEAIDSHKSSQNVTIHHNRVRDYAGTAHRPGIYVDSGSNVEVSYNIISDQDTTFGMALDLNVENASLSADNITFHHNVIYNCAIGLSLDVQGLGTGLSDVGVYHNTFYHCTKQGIYYNSRCLDKLTGTNAIQNNIFDASTSNDIQDDSTGNFAIGATTISHNFFVTGNPSETQGSSAVVAASPLFVDAAGSNFQLQAGSPAINAGVIITGINDDYLGTAPDIGAFEYPVTGTLFEVFSEHLAEGEHLFQATGDTIKWYLSNDQPSRSLDAVKADHTEIGSGNGYDAGGKDSQNDTSRTGGTTSVTTVDAVITASGNVGPFRYIVAYNSTATSLTNPLIAYWDYGASISLAAGETFTIAPTSNAILEIT